LFDFDISMQISQILDFFCDIYYIHKLLLKS